MAETTDREMKMDDVLMNEMIDRFLSWPIPESFSPDHYISFDRNAAIALRARTNGVSWPTGTNVFNAGEARQMLEHIAAPLLTRLLAAERGSNNSLHRQLDAALEREKRKDSERCVELQSGRDGVWAHFRVGKGPTYSINLDAVDGQSGPFYLAAKAFADSYRAALSGGKE